jgi:DNA-binding MarR family transcriptional regulator
MTRPRKEPDPIHRPRHPPGAGGPPRAGHRGTDQGGMRKAAKPKTATPHRRKGLIRGLSAAQETYAVSRAKGLTITEAAREAGSKRPHEAGSRWEKAPLVRARIVLLKKGAGALVEAIATAQAAQVPAQEETQPEQDLASQETQAAALPHVADLAEVLQYTTHTVRTVGRRKVKRGWIEYERLADGSVRPVEVEETVDGDKAADTLIRHLDAVADRDAGLKQGTTVQALILQLVNGPSAAVDAGKLLRGVLGTGKE